MLLVLVYLPFYMFGARIDFDDKVYYAGNHQM